MKERLKEAVRRMLSSRMEKEEGVTLIELLAVVVILGIIAAVAIPIVNNSIKTSKENTTKQNMAIIAQALGRYAADNDGSYPTLGSSGTYTDLTKSNQLSSYLQSVPQDGWNGDFYFYSDGTNYTLKTAQGAPGASTPPNGDEAWTMTNSQSTPTKDSGAGSNTTNTN